jgi:hypothetical protein
VEGEFGLKSLKGKNIKEMEEGVSRIHKNSILHIQSNTCHNPKQHRITKHSVNIHHDPEPNDNKFLVITYRT